MPNSITNFKVSRLGYYIFGFFNQRFLVEFFYNKYIVNTVLNLGGQTTKVLDKGSIEWVGPYGIYWTLLKIGKTITSLSKGVVTDYALYILIAVCFYLSLFTFVWTSLDTIHSITISCVTIFICISYYLQLNETTKTNENNLESTIWTWNNTKEIWATKVKIIKLAAKYLTRK